MNSLLKTTLILLYLVAYFNETVPLAYGADSLSNLSAPVERISPDLHVIRFQLRLAIEIQSYTASALRIATDPGQMDNILKSLHRGYALSRFAWHGIRLKVNIDKDKGYFPSSLLFEVGRIHRHGPNTPA